MPQWALHHGRTKPRHSHEDAVSLRPGFLLFLLEKRKERNPRYLDDLEADTRNIAYSVARATEPGNKNFIVFIDIVQATIARHKSSDLLAVLNQLDANAFTNGRVGLNTDNEDTSCADI